MRVAVGKTFVAVLLGGAVTASLSLPFVFDSAQRPVVNAVGRGSHYEGRSVRAPAFLFRSPPRFRPVQAVRTHVPFRAAVSLPQSRRTISAAPAPAPAPPPAPVAVPPPVASPTPAPTQPATPTPAPSTPVQVLATVAGTAATARAARSGTQTDRFPRPSAGSAAGGRPGSGPGERQRERSRRRPREWERRREGQRQR